ncbi:MAG: nucleotidyl transferase AbiEii/AbiGii toxin family protein [Oscillospiraceae bacterium]|jgi:hypothetical protein|nr:nucleotidyl transferase AbiEii/AbiGii toxin family protein [Oscillospiraceae bacterium]
MIAETSFTKDWLLTVNTKLGWNRQEAQLKNLEKAIAALHLLECLVNAELNFIFKGGTSLILLLDKIHRLSVDIDVIVEEPIVNTEATFSRVCTESKIFSRVEKQEREIDEVFDTEHYKFYYQPFADDADESYILLDLYYIASPYAKTMELEITSDILSTDGTNARVRTPDIDSILGDKLTAFAPTTIGISLSAEPGHRPKRVEVLKQLYDIGNLFDRAENASAILASYNAVATHEIEKFGLTITPEDVLKDSAHYALIIGHGGKTEKQQYDTIAKGFKDFNKFVSDLSFDENQAILAAAKVAYLVKILLSDGNTLEKYDNTVDILQWEISGKEFADFNDYKYSNPEAFFYWVKALG